MIIYIKQTFIKMIQSTIIANLMANYAINSAWLVKTEANYYEQLPMLTIAV